MGANRMREFVVAMFIVIAVAWVLGGNAVMMRRETFEQSRSLNEGMIRELQEKRGRIV